MCQALTVLRACDRSASKTDKNPFPLGADVLVEEQNRDVTTALEGDGEGKAEEGWEDRTCQELGMVGSIRGSERA